MVLALVGSSGPASAADVNTSITIGGDSATVTLTNSGDVGYITFSGTTGQNLGLGLSDVTIGTSSSTSAQAWVRKPDGSNLVWPAMWFGTSGSEMDLPTLPVDGTYTIVIDPYSSNTGSVTLTLSEDVTGSITVGGSSTSVTMSRIGQNGRVTFSGTAGQNLGLGGSNVTIGTSGCCTAIVSVLKPDGSTLQNADWIGPSGSELDLVTLPVSGTYTIFIDPDKTKTGSATLTLSEDATGTITTGGTSTSVSMSRIGQNGRVTFSGASGQNLALALTNVTVAGSSCCSMLVSVRKPDGSNLLSPTFVGTNGADLALATFPVDGTYTIFLDPDKTKTGGATLTLRPKGDAPVNAAQVELATPGFYAEPVSGTVDYQFQIASDSGFTQIVDDSGWLPTTNTYTPPVEKLKNGSTYYWRWRASTGNWSSGRSFTVSLPFLGMRDYWAMWKRGPLAVNLVTGNLVLSLPGPSYPTALGSMGASLAYNSLDTGNRGLGAGWTLVAGDGKAAPPVRLVDHNLLTGAARTDAVEVVASDGGATFYAHVGRTNTYVAEPGDGSVLTKNANATWTLIDGVFIYSFGVADGASGTATLTAVESADASRGNGELTYTFSAQDPTKITAITDDAGRSLTFTWNSLDSSVCPDAIVCIRGPDNVTWRYVGDGSGGTSGKLARVNNGTRDLFAVSYDASARVNKLQNANDLNPNGASPGYEATHAVTVSYDGSGRVASVSEGPITGQTPSTSTWSFAYTPGQVSTTATRAAHAGLPLGTIRTADGFTTVTPPRQQGEPTPKVVKTYYDNLGHPIEVVDQLGNVTMAGYSARDQLLWKEDEDGNPTDYSWDDATGVPLSVTGPDPDAGGPLARPVTGYRYDETQIGTSSTPGAALQGLQAAYYDNVNLAGRPKARQTDGAVDFNWGTGAPSALPGISDYFSVRWVGNLIVETAGSYTLSTYSDEGSRLTIDGIQAINNWKDQTATAISSQPITLSAGTHKLVLEYYEKTGSAQVQLRWQCSGCSPSIPLQTIPSSALRPAWMNRTSVVSPEGRVNFAHVADSAAARVDYALVKLADGTNVITSYTYDDFGRVTQKVMPKGNAGRTIDAQGDLQGSPNLTYATTFAYYGLTETAGPPTACGGGTAVTQAGLLKSVTRNGIAATTTVYDTGGRPIATTNGAGTTCRTYSGEGRLTADRAPGESQDTTYAYDPAGALRAATNAAGTLTNEYDEAGRLKNVVDSFGAEARLTYDSEGNLIERVAAKGALSSNPNYTTSHAYDAEGKQTSGTDPAGRIYSFTYDKRALLKTVQYPNTTFSWADYNAAGRLTALYNRHGTLSDPLPNSVPTDSQGSPIVDFAYAYDVEGRKTEETRTGGGLTSETTTYSSYDNLGRLAELTLPDGTCRKYGFDLDSNRTEIREGASCGSTSVIATYTYDPAQTPGLDQLTNVATGGQTNSYVYSSDGQVSQRGSDTLTWDGRARLSGGTFGGNTVTYAFDPLGFRRQRVSGTQTTRYLLGGLFETDGASTLTVTDVDGPAGDLAQYTGAPATGTSVSFLYYNGHGDVAATADVAGARNSAYTFDPFGGLRSGGMPANATSERFVGRWDKKVDSISGLVEMGARPYDSAIGRFYAADPVEGGSLNTYDYARGDSANVYDLSGAYASDAREAAAAAEAQFRWGSPATRALTAKTLAMWRAGQMTYSKQRALGLAMLDTARSSSGSCEQRTGGLATSGAGIVFTIAGLVAGPRGATLAALGSVAASAAGAAIGGDAASVSTASASIVFTSVGLATGYPVKTMAALGGIGASLTGGVVTANAHC
ncbi:MAG: PA14 domain-containing protein [Gaiellales bacterium]